MKTRVRCRIVISEGEAMTAVRNPGVLLVVTPRIQVGEGPVSEGYLEIMPGKPGELEVTIDDGIPETPRRTRAIEPAQETHP